MGRVCWRTCHLTAARVCVCRYTRAVEDYEAAQLKAASDNGRVQPVMNRYLAEYVKTSLEKAFWKAPVEPLGPLVPFTHGGHRLHGLHRSLGFPGCPTDAAWPCARECAPILGVSVPGEPDKGVLVGWSMTKDVFPFRMDNTEDDNMFAILNVPARSLVQVS